VVNAAMFHVAGQATLARSGKAPTESRVRRFGRDDLDERRLRVGPSVSLFCSWWASLDFVGWFGGNK
jgi:hypothetical protein